MIGMWLILCFPIGVLIYQLCALEDRVDELESKARGLDNDIASIGRTLFMEDRPPYNLGITGMVATTGQHMNNPAVTEPGAGEIVMVSEGGTDAGPDESVPAPVVGEADGIPAEVDPSSVKAPPETIETDPDTWGRNTYNKPSGTELGGVPLSVMLQDDPETPHDPDDDRKPD